MAIETQGSASIGREQPIRDEAAGLPRLLVLSNVRLLCDGLLLALAQQPSVHVLGARSLSDSIDSIVSLLPDVILLDIGIPTGLALSPPLRQALPNAKIVAIAVAEIEDELMVCAKAGVSGFVSRDGSVEDVMAAVHCAIRGELSCSPRTAALLFGKLARMESPATEIVRHDILTRRENEIAALIGEGLSNKEIARRLRIQNPTVKNHIHSILGKLQLRSRGEVAAHIYRSAR